MASLPYSRSCRCYHNIVRRSSHYALFQPIKRVTAASMADAPFRARNQRETRVARFTERRNWGTPNLQSFRLVEYHEVALSPGDMVNRHSRGDIGDMQVAFRCQTPDCEDSITANTSPAVCRIPCEYRLCTQRPTGWQTELVVPIICLPRIRSLSGMPGNERWDLYPFRRAKMAFPPCQGPVGRPLAPIRGPAKIFSKPPLTPISERVY